MSDIVKILFEILISFSFLSLATMGIVLIFKTSSTTNFAQGMLGILGAYLTSYLIDPIGINKYTQLPTSYPSSLLHLVLAVLGGMLLSFIVGLFIDSVVFRFSKYTNAATKQIITMGIVIILTGAIPLAFGETVFRASFQFSNKTLQILGSTYTMHRVVTLLLAATIISSIFILLKYTKWGLGVRSVASNEKIASLMGVNPFVINGSSWAIAGALGALSAITYTAATNVLNVAAMTNMQIDAFYSGILGGFSTFAGPIFGAFILTFGKVIIPRFLVRYNLATLSNTILYFLIIFIVLIKPNGVFGKKTVKKV